MASKKIQGITIEINGDTKKLNDALKDVDKQVYGLNSDLKSLNQALKLDPKNTELLAQKYDVLKRNIESTKERLEALKTAQQQMGNYSKLTDDQKKSYNALSAEIAKTENALKSLTKEYNSFGNVAIQKLKAVSNNLKETGEKVKDIGNKFRVPSTVAAGALTGLSAAAVNFESAFTGVTKTVDGTEEQLSKIKQGILDLAKSTSSSASEIAAVAEVAGQLGVSTNNIQNFTEQMVRLGDSTNLSAEEASSSIAQLYNVMGSDINTVDRFGSALVALGNNAATTEKDILEMATRIASSGHQIGLSEKEVLALSTTLSSVGLSAEAGGSAISKVLSRIDKDIATNNDSVKEWAKLAGVSSAEFKKQWETNTMGAIQSVITGLGNVKEAGGNLNVLLEELDINELRTTDSIKRLSSASELLSKMVGISNDAWNENDALLNESNKRYDTTESKINQTKASITELAVKLGEQLLPIIQQILTAISNVINWLTNLNPEIQNILLSIVAFVAAIGPVIIIIGKIISGIGTILSIMPNIVPIIELIKTATSGLFTLIAAHPIIAVITGIIAAITLLWNNCEWFRDGVTNLVKGIFQTITNIFLAIGKTFENIAKNVGENFTKFANGLIEGGKKALEFFIQLPFKATQWVMDFINKVKNTFVNIISNTNWGELGSNIVKGILNGFVNIGQFIWNAVTNVKNAVVNGFKSIFGIHSPSRLMRDEVGTFIGEGVTDGIVEGLEDTEKEVNKAMRQLASGIEASVNPIINPTANTNPLYINIDKFYNKREQDVQSLAQELEYYRKNSSLATGGQ